MAVVFADEEAIAARDPVRARLRRCPPAPSGSNDLRRELRVRSGPPSDIDSHWESPGHHDRAGALGRTHFSITTMSAPRGGSTALGEHLCTRTTSWNRVIEMKQLSHRVENVGGRERHVIELPNGLGGEVVDDFYRLTMELISRPGSRIRVDCRHVDDLSEEVIAVVLAAHGRAQRTGGRVFLDVRANPRLLRIFRATNLGFLGDDDEGLAGTPSPLDPGPTPRSGQDKRAMPGPEEEEQAP